MCRVPHLVVVVRHQERLLSSKELGWEAAFPQACERQQERVEEELTYLKKIAPRVTSRTRMDIACALGVTPVAVTAVGLKWTCVPYVE